ncbi:hypothetical protein ABQE48_16775 [Mycolicibacterium thermoresistibile]
MSSLVPFAFCWTFVFTSFFRSEPGRFVKVCQRFAGPRSAGPTAVWLGTSETAAGAGRFVEDLDVLDRTAGVAPAERLGDGLGQRDERTDRAGALTLDSHRLAVDSDGEIQ